MNNNLSYSMYLDTTQNKLTNEVRQSRINNISPQDIKRSYISSSSFDIDTIIENDSDFDGQHFDDVCRLTLIKDTKYTTINEEYINNITDITEYMMNENKHIPVAYPVNQTKKERSVSVESNDSITIIPKLGSSPHTHDDYMNKNEQLKKMSIESRRVSKWVEDSSVAKCYQCGNKFSFMLRKHHCRLCGRVFCYYCSNYYTKLPLDILKKIPDKPKSYTDYIWGDDMKGDVRVCGSCFSHSNKLIRIRKIIKVFEFCGFNIRDLNILATISDDWNDAVKFCLSKFRDIQYKLSIEELTPIEKRMLWNNRNYLTGHSRWMVQLVKATNTHNQNNMMILEQLLYKKRINRCWDIKCSRFCSETITINDMLDLIRHNNNNNIISNFILNCLILVPKELLKNYMPFLVLNIKNNEFIFDILLDKGNNDFDFISNMYWCIKVYCVDITLRKAYAVKILKYIVDNMSKEFRDRFVNMLSMGKINVNNLDELKNKNIILPVCPEIDFTGIDNKHVKIMSSYSRPVIIPFIKKDGTKKLIMYKNDDVRKDYIILSIINIINDILKNEEGMDIMSIKYNVVPTSATTGYIEIVENASTIFNIVENSGMTIQNYILGHNKNLVVSELRDRFIKSTALYCVISYLFGIGDRHLDNIMISQSGLLFHIDFGYILGQDPKYSNNRLIRVTPEIVNVIGGYQSKDYEYFKKCCVRIYNRLRLHVNLFSNLLSVMPVIDKSINLEVIRRELIERFEIGENCIEAATHMDNKVESKNNFEYMIIDFLYKSKHSTIGQGIAYVKDSIYGFIGGN